MSKTLRIICFGLLSLTLGAQNPFFWKLTDEDGLPSMTIYDICQDQKGYIWIGTASGLCRYDGQNFTYYDHPEQMDKEILRIDQDTFGRIWYHNLVGQIFYVEEGKVYSLKKKHEIDSITFKTFYADPDKLFCIYNSKLSENRGILKIYDLKPKAFEKRLSKTKVFPFHLSGFYSKASEHFLYSTAIGRQPVIIELNFEESQLENKLNKRQVEIISNWTGSPNFKKLDGGLNCWFSNNNFHIWNDTISEINLYYQTHSFINNILFTDKKLIILTKDGILNYQLEQNKMSEPLFKNMSFSTALIDLEKNLWLGTEGNGILVVPNDSFITHSNAPVFTLEYLKNNDQIAVGGKRGKVALYDTESKKIIHEFLTNKNGRVTSLIQTGGQIIFSTDENIWIYNERNHHLKSLFDGRYSIKDLEIIENEIWLATYNSTRVINKNKVLNSPRKKLQIKNLPSVVNQRTYSVLMDSFRNIWIGTAAGVYNFTNDKPVLFKLDNIPDAVRVTDMKRGRDSTIWVSTHGQGIIQIKNDKLIHSYSIANGLISNICHKLFVHNHQLWVATDQGVQVIHTDTDSTTLINKYDGLPTNEVNALAIANQVAWIGTPKGLVSMPLSSIKTNTVAPPIYIQNVSINERDTTVQQQFHLSYYQNNINIDYLGLGYRSRGNLQYRYRLLGLDSSWLSTSAEFARFPGLQPGHYTFEVVTLNEDGVSSYMPAQIQFHIAPPWWATWWFRTLAIGSVVLLIWGIAFLYFKNIREKERREAKFKEAFNELRMKALQTQMNPHFIFNALNAIQQYLTISDEEQAMKYLSRFARLIRLIFEHSKTKSITLEEEIELLDLYLQLEKLRFFNKVGSSLDVEKSLKNQMADIRIPPLLIQPVIENAFKHGMLHKRGKGWISVRFFKDKNLIKCIVEDNGVGRKKANKIAAWRPKNHQSSGLKATRERLHLLHIPEIEEKEEKTYLDIVDKYDKDGNPNGTRVEISIRPL